MNQSVQKSLLITLILVLFQVNASAKTWNANDPTSTETWINIFIIILLILLITLAITAIAHKKWRKARNAQIAQVIRAIHELRKPLELIKSPLAEISKDTNIDEELRKKLNIAIWSASNLQNTITYLTELEKSEHILGYIMSSTEGNRKRFSEKIKSRIESKQEKYTSDLLNTEQHPNKDPLSDQIFMGKLITLLKSNLENPDFSIEILCQHIGMSRSSLYHRIKTITSLAPADFIRHYRLEQAKDLLSSHLYTTAEVAYKTGFSDVKYFRSVFKKQYQITPGIYAKIH